MEESDPEFDAEYEAELKRIKLQKARDKARQDIEREEKAASRAEMKSKFDKFASNDWLVFCVLMFFILLLVALIDEYG